MKTAEPLKEIDKSLIRLLQGDISLTERPFKEISEKMGISEKEVIERGKTFLEKGYIRRFGATLRHRQAGFSANGMGVWIVPEEDRERVGGIMATFKEVTHCYERPSFEGWPYNLFTMIHGKSKEECFEIAKRISEATGIKKYGMLFSSKEFKKTSMKYF